MPVLFEDFYIRVWADEADHGATTTRIEWRRGERPEDPASLQLQSVVSGMAHLWTIERLAHDAALVAERERCAAVADAEAESLLRDEASFLGLGSPHLASLAEAESRVAKGIAEKIRQG